MRTENRYCPHCKRTESHLIGKAFGGVQFWKCVKCGSHKFSVNQVYKVPKEPVRVFQNT